MYSLNQLKIIKEILRQYNSFHGDVRAMENLRIKTNELIDKTKESEETNEK